MFSSNQVLLLSGPLDGPDLEQALAFALEFSDQLAGFGTESAKSCPVYQITADGKFCIGWRLKSRTLPHWADFPVPYTAKQIAGRIRDHLRPMYSGPQYTSCGVWKSGFLMSVISESMASESQGVKNPFYGIVSFEVFPVFYSK